VRGSASVAVRGSASFLRVTVLRVPGCVAVCIAVCVAVRVAVCRGRDATLVYHVLQCCSVAVLQCCSVCCSVLQCVAVAMRR